MTNLARKAALFLIFTMLNALGALNAQTLEKYIEKDAFMVFSLDMKHIDSQADLEKLEKIPMINTGLQALDAMGSFMGMPSVNAVLENQGKYGLDLLGKWFVSLQDDNGEYLPKLVVKLSDGEKFGSFLTNDILKSSDGVKDMGNYKLFSMGEMTLSWNNEALVVVATTEQGGGYDEGEEGETGSDNELFARIKEIAMESMDLGSNSLSTSNAYKSVAKTPSAGKLWMDYKKVIELSNSADMLGDMSGGGYETMAMDMYIQAMQKMYDDSYLIADLNFNKGELEVSTGMQMNNSLYNYTQNIYDAKINKQFAKYVKGENLLGFWAVAFDMENTIRGLEDMFMPVLAEMPIPGVKQMAENALDVIGIAIDEESLYNLLEGDMMLALTGVGLFESTETRYDEDFNAYEHTQSQVLPEFNLMATFGNEENILKLLKMAESTSFLVNEGDYYTLAVPGMDIPMELYLATTKNFLMVTNDGDLVKNHLAKGLSGKDRMSKTHRKMLKNKVNALHIDLPKVIDAVKESSPMDFEDPSVAQVISGFKNTFKSFSIMADNNVTNPYFTKASINFVDEERNSLEQLLNYINEIYLTVAMSSIIN